MIAEERSAYRVEVASEQGGRVRLGPADAAVFETFVVPRYLSLFGELALEALIESAEAQVVHLFCRTGYPDRGIAMKLPGAHIIGLDGSQAALELARAKAATMPAMISEYRGLDELPALLPSAAFSHAINIHPPAGVVERTHLLTEFGRLLAPHGQAVISLPLRGSYQELADLLREYALKVNDDDVVRVVEQSAQAHPTVEALGDELTRQGFDFVDVTLRPTTIGFRSGRDFFEDPIARLLILPEIRKHFAADAAEKALAYVREAIDTYWSEETFELTVNVGCAVGRRLP